MKKAYSLAEQTAIGKEEETELDSQPLCRCVALHTYVNEITSSQRYSPKFSRGGQVN